MNTLLFILISFFFGSLLVQGESITASYSEELLDSDYDELRASLATVHTLWSYALNIPTPLKISYELSSEDSDMISEADSTKLMLSYEQAKALLEIQGPEPWSLFPQNSEDFGDLLNFPETASWNERVVLTYWNALALDGAFMIDGLDPIVRINQNMIPMFDFDPSDGILEDKIDFVAAMLRQTGTVLGFVSAVDKVDAGEESVGVYPLDMIRFTQQGRPTFNSSERQMNPAEPEHWFDNGASRMSVPFSRGMNADGAMAGYWAERPATDAFGIMDPFLRPGETLGISQHDLNAFEAIGWNIQTPLVPWIDSYLLQEGGRVMLGGYLFSERTVCRFNEDPETEAAPRTGYEELSWRAVVCQLPPNLDPLTDRISVAVSNDGETFTSEILIAEGPTTGTTGTSGTTGAIQVPDLEEVTPNHIIVPAEGGEFTLNVQGDGFSENRVVECIVSGRVFPATVTSNTELECHLTFDEAMMQQSSQQGSYLIVKTEDVYSDSIEFFYTAPIMLRGGIVQQGKRVVLMGDYLWEPLVCEFESGVITPGFAQGKQGTTLVCDLKGVPADASEFNVRVSDYQQASNWVTVRI